MSKSGLVSWISLRNLVFWLARVPQMLPQHDKQHEPNRVAVSICQRWINVSASGAISLLPALRLSAVYYCDLRIWLRARFKHGADGEPQYAMLCQHLKVWVTPSDVRVAERSS